MGFNLGFKGLNQNGFQGKTQTRHTIKSPDTTTFYILLLFSYPHPHQSTPTIQVSYHYRLATP